MSCPAARCLCHAPQNMFPKRVSANGRTAKHDVAGHLSPSGKRTLVIQAPIRFVTALFAWAKGYWKIETTKFVVSAFLARPVEPDSIIDEV